MHAFWAGNNTLKYAKIGVPQNRKSKMISKKESIYLRSLV